MSQAHMLVDRDSWVKLGSHEEDFDTCFSSEEEDQDDADDFQIDDRPRTISNAVAYHSLTLPATYSFTENGTMNKSAMSATLPRKVGSTMRRGSGGANLVCVLVESFEELVPRDLFSSNDAYVVVQVGENKSVSDVHYEAGANLTVEWFCSFPFDPLNRENNTVKIKAMDFDSMKRDDFIGKVEIPPEEYSNAIALQPLQKKYALNRISFFRRQKLAGYARVRVWMEEYQWPRAVRASLQFIVPFPVPKLRFVSNWSKTGGFMRQLVDGGSFHTFPTWQTSLWGVKAVFGDAYAQWNKKYPAAQKIFGETVGASMVRGVIRMQHSILYSKDQSMQGGQFTISFVEGMRDLFKLLNYGRIEGRAVRYTYVIAKDSSFHFSQTSKKTMQDMLSKHALHSNASKEVVYAGEFFIDTNSQRFKQTNVPALIIDNNSGTYAPDKANLISLKLLMELNFGICIPIIALDRDDPRLKSYFAQNQLE